VLAGQEDVEFRRQESERLASADAGCMVAYANDMEGRFLEHIIRYSFSAQGTIRSPAESTVRSVTDAL
jgi:hypothetical protein